MAVAHGKLSGTLGVRWAASSEKLNAFLGSSSASYTSAMVEYASGSMGFMRMTSLSTSIASLNFPVMYIRLASPSFLVISIFKFASGSCRARFFALRPVPRGRRSCHTYAYVGLLLLYGASWTTSRENKEAFGTYAVMHVATCVLLILLSKCGFAFSHVSPNELPTVRIQLFPPTHQRAGTR